MYSTDNFKALARRFDISVQAVREQARDLDLKVSYSPERRTWFLDESASKVVAFNGLLEVINTK